MLAASSALLLLAPPFLVAFALVHRQQAFVELPRKTIALIYVVCAIAPLLFALIWRIDATRIVLELHAIAFRGDDVRKDVYERRAGSGRVVIGGMETPSRRFGLLEFRRGQLTITLPPPAERAGLIATTNRGFLGAQKLENGDRVCIGSSCWTFDAGDLAFTNGKQHTRIPPRVAEVPGLGWQMTLPFARPIAAGARTWSLDWLAHDLGVVPSERRIRSFFAHVRGAKGLHLVVLDSDVTLMRGSAPVSADAKFTIDDGERISFYTLPPQGDGFAARGVQERRSAVYRAAERSFVLDLDTPEVHSLTVAELDALRDAKETKKKVVALSMGDAQLVDRSLWFAGLSESVAIEASSLLELSRYFPRDVASSFRILSPRGPMQAATGKLQWLGASDMAAIRLDVRRPPLLLLVAGLALLALKVFAASSLRLNVTQMLMAGAIEALIGIRLLFGYRTWAMPPHKLEAIELAIVAWLALPWIYLVGSASVKRWKEALPALAGLLVSMVLTVRLVEGPGKWVWVACHLLAIAVPFVRERRLALPARFDGMNPIIYAAIAFTIVRFLLLLFGFKESANLGARISLSVLHIPAALILQAIFFVRARKSGLQKRELLAAGAIILFVWLIPAAMTSDIGLALLNIPVFALMLLALTPRARWLVTAIVILLAGAPLFRLALPLVSSEEVLLNAASDSNYARFFHFAAPEQLRELATKRGETLAITSALLQSYISSGFFGRGFGHTEVSPHLGDTALRDFAPAVFIAAEWGLVGTLAALLLYLAFGVIARPWLEGSDAARVTAFLAALTISVSSIYMILANHELLLLTGKNAYLLGLDSAGDVIEVIVLVLMIAYGAAAARRERTFGGAL